MNDKLFYEESSFKYKGYLCKVLFMPLGHRCGYVKVPKYHPLFGKSYDECNEFIDCHGGLTYSGRYLVSEELKYGEYWIGFDCMHVGDRIDIESFKKYFPKEDVPHHAPSFHFGSVKTLEFCEEECKSIVDQLENLFAEKGPK